MVYSKEMDISYLGHSCFKLKGAAGTVVTDPFSPEVGLSLPQVSADIVTVSHHHRDHDAAARVKSTARRAEPFVIDAPGEYEVMGISIFGYKSFHDNSNGSRRGANTIMVITVDGVRIAHLGDLGHLLSDSTVNRMGAIDVLLVPVGGAFSLAPKQAAETARSIEPSIVIPMHYRTPRHSAEFEKLLTEKEFIGEMGKEGIEPLEKVSLTPNTLPEEMEIVVLKF